MSVAITPVTCLTRNLKAVGQPYWVCTQFVIACQVSQVGVVTASTPVFQNAAGTNTPQGTVPLVSPTTLALESTAIVAAINAASINAGESQQAFWCRVAKSVVAATRGVVLA